MRNLFFLLALNILITPSCDKCKEVDCNYGDCDKGNCNCYAYYEGSFCDIEMREKFYGRYDGVLKYDGTSEQVYTILKQAGNEAGKIDWDNTGYLLITGSTEFTIPEQLSTFNNKTYVLRGEGGNLSLDKLTIKWSLGYQGVTIYFEFFGYPHLGKCSEGESTKPINLTEVFGAGN